MHAVTLSIVIVNFETPTYTLECLRSIFANRPLCEFEVILVDNGSQDGSLDLVRDAIPEVICIETGSNLGFSRANNLGINNARGEFVLLLNSDTKILDNSLDRMLEFLRTNPKAGAIGPRQLDGEGKLQLSWGSFPTFFTEILRKLFHYRLSINDLKIRDYLEDRYAGFSKVDWISGSCLMVRREAISGAGLLDERYFMYFEDVDWCRCIREAGWEIYFNSDYTILHYGGVSARKNLLHVLVCYRQSQIYFTRKYYGLKGVFLLKMLLFLKASVNFLRWGLLYSQDRLFLRESKHNFSKLLLTKKTLQLVFTGKD